MTEDEVDDRVPPEIGEDEDWDQARKAMRDGYAAYLDGKEVIENPHRQKPWQGFSGYKRKKQKMWKTGWALAAIREGEFDSFEEVREELETRVIKPREPRKSLYRCRGWEDRVKPLDRGEAYLYKARGVGFFDTRHEAIGEAVTKDQSGRIEKPPLRLTRWVETWVRIRRPQLPPENEVAASGNE